MTNKTNPTTLPSPSSCTEHDRWNFFFLSVDSTKFSSLDTNEINWKQ